MGSVGSVQFQIVPCSSLSLFSRSIGPLQCLVNVNYRVLICCAFPFQSISLFLVYFGFLYLQVSSVSNFCLDIGGEDGHLFRLTCSVVLWGGRNNANKYHWCVWGLLTVYGPHWVCPSSRWRVLPRSTLLRFQGALQGHCPKQALCFMYFPGLSCSGSGSRVLHRSTHSVGCVFCALPRSKQLRQLGAWLAHCPRWAVHLNHLPGPSHLVSWV